MVIFAAIFDFNLCLFLHFWFKRVVQIQAMYCKLYQLGTWKCAKSCDSLAVGEEEFMLKTVDKHKILFNLVALLSCNSVFLIKLMLGVFAHKYVDLE